MQPPVEVNDIPSQVPRVGPVCDAVQESKRRATVVLTVAGARLRGCIADGSASCDDGGGGPQEGLDVGSRYSKVAQKNVASVFDREPAG